MNSDTVEIPTPASNRRRWLALVVICFGQFMIVLDSTIVNVALASIQRDLHFSQADLTWVVNAYLITFGSLLLLAGRAGDLIGRKKVFLAGIVLFTAASVLCGLAQDPAALIAARFLQGAGGALSSGVILALIVTGFPKPVERAQAMSVFTFVIAGGGSLGLLAGGVLTQLVSWHWIFFINLPVGVATFWLGAVLIDETEGLGLHQGVDIVGSILVTAAMVLGVYSIVTAAQYGWASAHTIGFGAAAVGLLASFLVLEGRIANPIMPLRVLRIRSLVGASVARAMLATGMFATFFLGTLYLQQVRGYSAVETGLAFLPWSISLGVLSLGITANLMRRFGPRRVLVPGMVAIVTSLAVMANTGENASYFPVLLGAYTLFGIGAGTSFMPLITIAMSEVPARDAGLASGIANVSMQISAAIGLAALGTISSGHAAALAAQGYALSSALTGGYQFSFGIAATCVALGLLVVLVVLRPRGRHQDTPIPRSELADGFAEAA
ncbi:MAG TPA: MFS transporter [Candidatus Acidoferrum sp.]|jgi:EmrB/QacA subfamily drug resistance transporter|nr:MFS transporter [Candidatus Acidoferrum sp.]